MNSEKILAKEYLIFTIDGALLIGETHSNETYVFN